MKLFIQSDSDVRLTASDRTILNILQTGNWVQGELNADLKPHGITLTQFNVLRILQEMYPDTLSCNDIRNRLLERGPDLTRLLDRLEKRGLIVRSRSKRDARSREIGLTEEAVLLMHKLSDSVDRSLRAVLRGLSIDERRLLSSLLERMRTA